MPNKNKRGIFYGVCAYIVANLCFLNAILRVENRPLIIGIGIILLILGSISLIRKDYIYKK